MSAGAIGVAWRFAALAGLAAGLALASHASIEAAAPPIVGVGCALVALGAVRPREGASRLAAGAWLAILAAVCAFAGQIAGGARIEAIDSGAAQPSAGPAVAEGFVTAVPSRSDGIVRALVETTSGRLVVEAPEPVGDLPIGAAVRATGTVRRPGEWERGRFEREGARALLAADSLERTSGERGGLTGALDRVRERASDALARGTEPAAANLLRGFVLGADDRIDAAAVADFKASGLAHLLAVSGQNIVLLSVLASFVLAALGVSLRVRLAWVLLAIAVYVPVAGAEPSIQRAGVMGAAGVVAALADRPRSRAWALLLAAAATLALDPRAIGDVGWQLSFAAVIGILVASGPIAAALAGGRGGWRGALAEAVALTVAATLATAPLMAHHFGAVSLVALPANLVALPAVAPVMWLGMAAAFVGQIPWIPVEPLSWPAGLFAAFIAQVAAWFGDPAFAQVEAGLEGGTELWAAYLALGAGLALGLAWARRRRGLGSGPARSFSRFRRLAALGLFALCPLVALGTWPGSGADPDEAPALRLTVLDVGQGDSILLEPADGDPILVDTGSAAAEIDEELAGRRIETLAALVITHPQEDHDGGAGAVLAGTDVRRLGFARARKQTISIARAAGTRPVRLAAGARLRSGSLALRVLWPPVERLRAARRAPPADANPLSLVILARCAGFEALLTGDAEAEVAPIEAGEVELLKVAHHGSEDAGLGRLLERARPRLATISVGAGNPYGHPSPTTLAELADHRVPVARTDLEGEIEIAVDGDRWALR